MYRGPKATACREARRQSDGTLRISVPGSGMSISVVSSYKHLGTGSSLHRADMSDARAKAAKTLAAYGPISCKVFASHLIQTCHKLYFMQCLLLTRLLFNIHVLVPSPRHLKCLNAVYMTVLRRIFGEPRFAATPHTDREVREALRQPSIECLIARLRLKYCARLVRTRPQALIAILHARPKGNKLRWIHALETDAGFLRPHLPPDLPALADDPMAWAHLMLDEDAWKALVDRIFFTDSVCDQSPALRPTPRVEAYVCECGEAFSSSRGLQSHQRAKHGKRNEVRFFVSGSTCPCCGTDFVSRLRLLSHLSDTRRPKCRTFVLDHCPRLSASTVQQLDLVDRDLRRDAQQAGRSHHIATAPARRADGRIIGRVSS